MSTHLKRKDYQAQLEPLQLQLVSMTRWLARTGKRMAVIFEGRDTAGKGGSIDAIREHLNPRQCKVLALPKPNDRESSQWYFQRYVSHLPAAGELLLMDRSWYNRAGVEKVMGYCTQEQYAAFLQQVPVFEQLLVDDGILLFKYWLTVDQKRQEERFAARMDNPLKGWKLSPVDLQAREKYEDYTVARETMLAATHSQHAPWTLVDFNNQKRGRLTLIRDLLSRLPDLAAPEPSLKLKRLGHRPLRETFDLLKPIPDNSDTE